MPTLSLVDNHMVILVRAGARTLIGGGGGGGIFIYSGFARLILLYKV